MIRVVVADGYAIVRQGLGTFLGLQDDIGGGRGGH